jgi:hypothetical protein
LFITAMFHFPWKKPNRPQCVLIHSTCILSKHHIV